MNMLSGMFCDGKRVLVFIVVVGFGGGVIFFCCFLNGLQRLVLQL